MSALLIAFPSSALLSTLPLDVPRVFVHEMVGARAS